MKTKIAITLGYKTENRTREIVTEQNGRIKNWRSPKASTQTSRNSFGYFTHNLGRYSCKCRYTHYEYSPFCISFGVILEDGKRFAGRVAKSSFNFTAPRGYIFSSDDLGAKLVSIANPKKDYHFNSDEILDGGIKSIVKNMRANFAMQAQAKKVAAQQKRDAEIKSREIGSVRVTISDSRRAGNCLEGTLQYAEQRLHIPRQEIVDAGYLFSVPAGLLLKTNGHDGVKRAVDFAWSRETMVQI